MTKNAELALKWVRIAQLYDKPGNTPSGQSFQELMCEIQGTQTHRLEGSGLGLHQVMRVVVGGWL